MFNFMDLILSEMNTWKFPGERVKHVQLGNKSLAKGSLLFSYSVYCLMHCWMFFILKRKSAITEPHLFKYVFFHKLPNRIVECDLENWKSTHEQVGHLIWEWKLKLQFPNLQSVCATKSSVWVSKASVCKIHFPK